MSKLPLSANSAMMNDLSGLLRSSALSVPTSSLRAAWRRNHAQEPLSSDPLTTARARMSQSRGRSRRRRRARRSRAAALCAACMLARLVGRSLLGYGRALPRARLPTSRGSMAYFSSRRLTAVSAMETTSSWSPQNAMRRWPRPLVYLPGPAPSKRSSSAWSTCAARHLAIRMRRQGQGCGSSGCGGGANPPLARAPGAAPSRRSESVKSYPERGRTACSASEGRSARSTRAQRGLPAAPRLPALQQRPASGHTAAPPGGSGYTRFSLLASAS